jgi:hypothetical protein
MNAVAVRNLESCGQNPTLDGAQHRPRLLASDAALDQHASKAVRPVIELSGSELFILASL